MNARSTRTNSIAELVRPLLACLLLIGPAARAGIVITNFTGTNVIRILPAGDSITDDCEVEGAWRRPLEPLLDSNHIPFIFIGRNVSTAVQPYFTKTRHEGYCGAVVAPPGVYGPVYSYAEANNYTEKTISDALKTTAVANPNVVLVLIGANDIGRGRDPYHTAYIDMTNLLNLILTNVPTANVIFTKITSLSNASLGYGTYSTNVPIYNNALEQMVNQKRAEGMNVTLADMFSVNPYGTAYYMSDHLHANAAGLTNIAREWFTRIQTLITGTNRITAALISAGATWSYSDTGTDLGTNWTQLSYDDSAWASGPARFGYGEPVPETQISFGSDSTNVNPTTYFRTEFVVPWNEDFTNLNFRLSQTGGAVVWLNGVEAYRTNLPAGPITYSTLASTNIGNENEYILFATNLALTLPPGTNVIAVEVHQSALTNRHFGFDFELLGGALVLPNPGLTATLANNNISLTWPLTNGGAFTLYSSATLDAPNWQALSPSLLQTNNGQISAAITPGPGCAFFRLQLSQ
ncbi:MAG: GDSL-type esterase/lipase family protein [Verrucomicrobiota bacterium]|jgi:lysophospholipase L1-like esterase